MKKILMFALLIPFQVSAAWFAKLDPNKPNKIKECVLWNETLDESWRVLEKQFGRCDFRTDSGFPIKGYVFSCGTNKNFFLFRSKDDCELARSQTNEGKEAKLEAFAPKGIRNPEGWIVAINGCMEKAAIDANIRNNGLQKISDYCLCTSKEVASHTEKELQEDGKKNSDISIQAIKKCLTIQGSKLSPDQEKTIRKAMKEKSEKAAAK